MSNPTELPDLDRADVRALSLINKIADLFHIGALARDESTILTNLQNTIRRADCLSAVEREFFMVPGELDDDYPDEKPDDECLLNWGHDPAQYVEQFRAALARRAQPEGEAPQAEAERYRYLGTLQDWSEIERLCRSSTASSATQYKCDLDKLIDARRPAAQQAESGARAANEQCQRERENADFTAWWNDSGQGADPAHTLITENAAHATWQERARRAALAAQPQGAQATLGGVSAAVEHLQTVVEETARTLRGYGRMAVADRLKDAVVMIERAAIAAKAEAPALTPLDYRAQGREEVLAIILGQSAEDPFSEYTGWSMSGAPDDEGGAYWKEDELRALLHIGDRAHDAYGRAEAMYWEALGRKDEAARELLFAQQAPFYKPLHDFLSKHQAWDLMADLKRAQQAAAPGALDSDVFFDALSDFEDSPMSVSDKQAFFDKLAAAPSAPGTPEAPAAALHPLQPLVEDAYGRVRFKRNAIVDHLATNKLNDLAAMDFPAEDWEQLAQLIGYSLDGFGTLSYVKDETYERAVAQPVIPRAAQLDGGQGEGA